MADKKSDQKSNLDISALPLSDQLQVKRTELQTTQQSLYEGTLQNPHAIKSIKKDIARILTQMNAADNVNNTEKGAN